MKKVILAMAALVCLYSCKNSGSDNKSGDNGATSTVTATPAEVSLTGKWHVVDMKVEDTALTNHATPEQMSKMHEEITKQNMTFDFAGDGTCNITMADKPTPTKTKYTKQGDDLTITDSTGNPSVWKLVNLTAKGVTLTSVKDKMSFVLEKM